MTMPTWHLQDGSAVLVAKMETGHIVNAIKMIERNTWHRLHEPSTPARRKLLADALSQHPGFIDLNKELADRLLSGSVVVGDFLPFSQVKELSVRVG